MFLNDQTVKFIKERDHYLRRNALNVEVLNDYHYRKIAEQAGVSLKTVLNDAKAFNIDLKHHRHS